MIDKILSKIENVNQSLMWIKANKREQYEQRFIPLVEERRKLRILANAECCNPGIAAFGQSQVGKSYLMNCILQNPDSPFMVDVTDGQYNFVDEINPIGEGAEATGVVTRFTSYEKNNNDYNLQYPIRMKVLSLKDILVIISDAYFNEFDDYTTLGENEIIEKCKEWKEKYYDAASATNPVLTADDILDMKYYFRKHINNAQVYSTKTPLFDTLALIIEKIPVPDYAEIFSLLWNRESAYTMLFDKAFNTIKKLNFENYVYLPIEAVLHRGKKYDTIMSVSCLNLLLTEAESQCSTTAYSMTNGEMQCLGTFSKSELCMICSEVIIKIGQEFIITVGEFDNEQMEELSSRKLPREEIRLDILRTTDLLDFPGARARGSMLLKQIQDHQNLMYTVLRGKVAYLFNKYNEERIINILMFCHHHKNVEAPQMWQLLNDWVNEYVGDTPEKRAKYIEQMEVSPLFHVGTMFNINLQNPDNGTVGKTEESIISRWTGRFETQLLQGCFKKTDYNWVSNWTGNGKPFQNCFMLRDYNFSQTIFEGWRKTGREGQLLIEQEYFERMRDMFIKCNENYKIFEDPALIWDVSATKNNDGSLYILQQLSKVSKKIAEGRERQIADQLDVSARNVYNIMKEYFISTDIDEILEGNIRKATVIFREMDFTCNSDNYYFGHLLQALQMSETISYRVVHSVIQGSEINSKVNDFKDYEIIRNSCKKVGCSMEESKTDDEKWECIIRTYGFSSKEEAEEILMKKGIDVRKLFDGSYKRKLNSCIIGDAVYDKWCSLIKSVDFLNEFSNEDSFDSNIMTMLVDNLISTANALNIRDRMGESIAEYVNVVNIYTANESLLADMLASRINDFVIDFGFKYLSEEDVEEAKKVCKKRNIPAFNYIYKELPATFGEEELTVMFNEMSTRSQALLPSFDDNYNKWLEYMFISFVARLDTSDFDHGANQALALILDKIKAA